MTREAKIGMLTGLGVIVLIGVLLSNYLGQNPSPRMANAQYGAAFRDQVTKPLVVPDAAANAGYRGDQTPPPAYAMRDTSSANTPDMNGSVSGQPIVGQPVTPVADGRALGVVPPAVDGLPTFRLSDGNGQLVSIANSVQPNKPASVTSKQYVIVQGDTLAKIAAKFYKSANTENEQQIVAANPAVLKNLNSTLMIGKKLTIPDMPTAVADAGKADVDTHLAKGPTVLIHPPGAKGGDATDGKTSDPHLLTAKADAPKKEIGSVYVVKQGDTLGTIAAHYLGTSDKSAAAKMVSKIVSLNKIQDPESLQVGMKLKLPTKA